MADNGSSECSSALIDKQKGNECYGRKEYDAACEYYTSALGKQLSAEDRAACYANRAAAKLKLENYEGAIEDCTEALNWMSTTGKRCIEEKRLGWLEYDVDVTENTVKCYVKLGRYAEALEDLKILVEAQQAKGTELQQLEQQKKLAEEREKEEALSKLKEVGNSVLGYFGLSTDNFKLDKDPVTGSYNVRFEK